MKGKTQSDKGFCEIRIKGKPEPRWAEWFDLMKVEIRSETIIISGFMTDQAVLKGLMEKFRCLV
jgi:hypothetical protein